MSPFLAVGGAGASSPSLGLCPGAEAPELGLAAPSARSHGSPVKPRERKILLSHSEGFFDFFLLSPGKLKVDSK